ncbi:MAG: hypothetical protein KGY50_04330 [Candidatus Thermoplasmatota archaeon]|nr:hypothetical protein [Candidatus Thermoplasmatota archaeon]
MHKKTILLELPAEIVDRIDQQNMTGDRSTYISNLLGNQFKTDVSLMDAMDGATELSSLMKDEMADVPFTGELKLTTAHGKSVGKFNINNAEGFTEMAETIAKMSDDPIVRMKARKML